MQKIETIFHFAFPENIRFSPRMVTKFPAVFCQSQSGNGPWDKTDFERRGTRNFFKKHDAKLESLGDV